MIHIGEKIPDFTVDAYVPDSLTKITLSQYKGKWLVLLFYPADFTFVCPTELAEAEHSLHEFKKLEAEIVSVSTDTSFVHKAWHDHSEAIGEITYPMLADPSGVVCRAFGTYIEKEGLSLRATFIIDPDQTLVAYEMHDNSIGRSITEILRKLQAADFVRKNHGALVCPASWSPGGKTLKPGIDLVGKI